jgi:hypothetical protein
LLACQSRFVCYKPYHGGARAPEPARGARALVDLLQAVAAREALAAQAAVAVDALRARAYVHGVVRARLNDGACSGVREIDGAHDGCMRLINRDERDGG